MIEDRERKTGRELLMILIKAVICLLWIYFDFNNPQIYKVYPYLAKVTGGLMIFLGPSLQSLLLDG